MDSQLLGKCGFYCGSCPSFINGGCGGCMLSHRAGDCYTRDCVVSRKLAACGECPHFPCDTILEKPRCTVLDKDWLLWKKRQRGD